MNKYNLCFGILNSTMSVSCLLISVGLRGWHKTAKELDCLRKDESISEKQDMANEIIIEVAKSAAIIGAAHFAGEAAINFASINKPLK